MVITGDRTSMRHPWYQKSPASQNSTQTKRQEGKYFRPTLKLNTEIRGYTLVHYTLSPTGQEQRP